eukprot:Gb_35263 [translate_table: standard]
MNMRALPESMTDPELDVGALFFLESKDRHIGEGSSHNTFMSGSNPTCRSSMGMRATTTAALPMPLSHEYGVPTIRHSFTNTKAKLKWLGSQQLSEDSCERKMVCHPGSRSETIQLRQYLGPYKVYGLLQCRGDTSPDECWSCSQEASTSIRGHCPNGIGGRVWLEMCFLRYENYNFFSRLDAQRTAVFNPQIVTDSAAFSRNAIWTLLSNLAVKASKPANKGFATGKGAYSSSREVYGLVQCWNDISAQDCISCLKTGVNILYQCYSQRQGAESMSGSCTVRYEIYSFYNSVLPAPKIQNNLKRLPIIFGLAGCLFFALFMICLFGMKSKIKCARFGKPISLSQAKVATDNFNKNNKLGEGGFGPVYKGRISDGTEVAVKMLSVRSMQGKREFMNEVKLVAKIQHRNLVRLLGCCSEGPEKLLVYEYLPNKSLDTFLFDPEKRKLLDWKKRYNIIIGIVRGLLYLHQDSQLRIIHRDIKASNILLDDNLNPKIADFGLAKFFPEGETHVSTRVVGTYGYMAPEYAMQGQLSVKADVYSFGVLLLEIVSGRKNTDFDLLPEMQILLGWAWRLHKEGRIVDADAAIRPQMRDVIWMLNSSEKLADPKKPAFFKYMSQNQNSTCTSGSQKLQRVDGLSHTTFRSSSALPHDNLVPSKNDITISELQPR